VLASGDVAAIVAWQPNSGQALQQVPGSKAVTSSADEPGLIYDVLAVTPSSLATRKDDWTKVAKVWYRVVDYILDEKTRPDALKIMAARVGLSPEEYAPLLSGTRLLTLDEAKAVMGAGEGFESLAGSSRVSDDFNVKYEVYAEPQDIDSYIDSSITMGL
jgi:NitT/TauT family transport system substrate-binding protein